MSMPRGLALAAIVFALVAAMSALSAPWLLAGGRGHPPVAFAPARPHEPWPVTPSRAAYVRRMALRRAVVWRRPAAPSDFSFSPPSSLPPPGAGMASCRFVPRQATGTTPKFDCALPDGEIVKVKYGRNAEIHAETAATRLLAAMGFGADHVETVPLLRCYGCPRFPFQTIRLMELLPEPLHVGFGREDVYTDFEWVAVERRFAGRSIEAGDLSGWAWHELDQMSAASRAERDALRLIAVFLAHWDNKMENQRLVCLDEGPPGTNGECERPFAFIQDAGASFGPLKVDLSRWRATPIWADATRCTVSMKEMPWGGGTFPDSRISEGGRRLLGEQLESLTREQITQLFEGARFPAFERGRWFGLSAPLDAWVDAFQERVRQVLEAGPCPA
jgi:hypothetical protein